MRGLGGGEALREGNFDHGLVHGRQSSHADWFRIAWAESAHGMRWLGSGELSVQTVRVASLSRRLLTGGSIEYTRLGC